MDKSSHGQLHKSKKNIENKQVESKLSDVTSKSSGSHSSNFEGTFIPLATKDSVWEGPKFFNPKFQDIDDDDDEVIQIVDLETEEREPLLLLFPDLDVDKTTGKKLTANASTSQLTKMLVGKKADFSFLKPSKKLTNLPLQEKLSPLVEDHESKTLYNT